MIETLLPLEHSAAGRNVAMTGDVSGSTLLLLHGVARRWQDFLPVMPALAFRHRLFAMDHRGHGNSEWTPGQYRVVDYVKDAVALVGDFGPNTAIYGHSLGAMVACAAAAAAPNQISALVLEDPPFHTLGERIRETPFHALFRGMHNVLAEGLNDVDRLAARLADVPLPALGGGTRRLGDVRDPLQLRFSASCLVMMDPEALIPLVEGRWLDGFDVEATLRQVRCPVLLLTGDYAAGGMLPAAEARKVKDLLSRCTHLHLPGAGHHLHWTHAEWTQTQILAFLETLSQP
jgi:pimeloyl-ACP methyl ester carboxylesterase